MATERRLACLAAVLAVLVIGCAAQERYYDPDYNACGTAAVEDLPFCNYTLPLAERVQDFVSRLTVEQVVQQMVTSVRRPAFSLFPHSPTPSPRPFASFGKAVAVESSPTVLTNVLNTD